MELTLRIQPGNENRKSKGSSKAIKLCPSLKQDLRRARGLKQCQYRKCENIRHAAAGKWYKCARCGLTAYCSKRCQKLDWEYGYHRKYCPLIVKQKKVQTTY